MEYNLESACALKHVIEDLFGRDAWYEIKHATDFPTWKKYSLKILSAVEFSAESTVEVCDKEWLKELKSRIEHGKKMISLTKDTEQLFSALAAALANVSFLQLGRVPSNALRKKVTLRHSGNWKLSQYRCVQYVQNKEQAAAKAKQMANTKAAHNKSLNQIGAKDVPPG